jgi:Tol biopolymer transport system component
MVPAAGGPAVQIRTFVELMSFSADGCEIAFTGQRGTGIMRWDGSQVRQLDGHQRTSFMWSPRGDRLAAEGSGGGIEIVDASLTSRHSISDQGGFHVRWSPDGTRLTFYAHASSSDAFHIFAIDVDGAGPQDVSLRPGVDPSW